MANIWIKKSIPSLVAAEGTHGNNLRRTLGRFNLIMLGIGGIVGAGIFVLTGQAAATYAGPAIVLSFVFAGIACAFAALCYSEFASMIPIAGSAYTYAYATLGEFIAWIIGWDLILEYLFGGATVSVGWSSYMVSLLASFNITVPPELCNAPFAFDATTHQWMGTGSIINLPAMFIVAFISLVLAIGIKESASFNNVIVIVKIVVILLFIGLGIFFISADHYDPFIPPNTGEFGHFGWSGIFRASGIVFYAYIGFDAVSTVTQEVRNPQKDMPWGIIGSLIVCTVLYVAVGFVMTGMVKYDLLNTAAPIAVAVDAAGDTMRWLAVPIKVGAIAGLSSVILVQFLGQTRIFYSMASDGLLPKGFASVHPKFQTPFVTTLITGFFAMLVGGLFPIQLLGELVSIGTLLAFVIVCAGVLVLRYRNPEIHRPFKTPLFPYVPILGIASSLGVMATLPGDTWLRLIVWMGIGIVIYFAYGRRKSKLNSLPNTL
ncbi:amino acid permease [Chryseolinea sp. T2]|uniref:amino acid permease n=1 Tax=Chryseolinea sp. T2 TaxID=3129255 RepID=UPI003077632F